MKKLITLFIIISNTYLYAATATIQILDLCSDTVSHSFIQDFNGETTVSAVTLSAFDQNGVTYLGAEQGFNSILGTPTGMDALEVISDTEMRAYGWCFTINGYLSHEMMDQTYFEEDSIVTWYYGFTYYDSGEWSGICTPARTVPTCHKL